MRKEKYLDKYTQLFFSLWCLVHANQVIWNCVSAKLDLKSLLYNTLSLIFFLKVTGFNLSTRCLGKCSQCMTFQNQNAVCRVLTTRLALAFSCSHVLNHTGHGFLFMALAPCFCSCSTLFAAASHNPFIFWQLIMHGWELLFYKWNEVVAAGTSGNYNDFLLRRNHWWGLWKIWRSLLSLSCAVLRREQRVTWRVAMSWLSNVFLTVNRLNVSSSTGCLFLTAFFLISSLMLPWYVKEFAQLWYCSSSRKTTWEAGNPIPHSCADFNTPWFIFLNYIPFLYKNTLLCRSVFRQQRYIWESTGRGFPNRWNGGGRGKTMYGSLEFGSGISVSAGCLAHWHICIKLMTKLFVTTFLFNCWCQMPVLLMLFWIVQIHVPSRQQSFIQDFMFKSLLYLRIHELLLKSCKITSKLGNWNGFRVLVISSLIVFKKLL